MVSAASNEGLKHGAIEYDILNKLHYAVASASPISPDFMVLSTFLKFMPAVNAPDTPP